MTLKEVEEKAQKLNREMSAYDFAPNTYVKVTTDEGAEFLYPSAFFLKQGDWFVVFAEHHNPVVFHSGDINALYSYEVKQYRTDVKEMDDFKPVDWKKKKKSKGGK